MVPKADTSLHWLLLIIGTGFQNLSTIILMQMSAFGLAVEMTMNGLGLMGQSGLGFIA